MQYTRSKPYRITRRNLMSCVQAAAVIVAPENISLAEKENLTIKTANNLAAKLAQPETTTPSQET